MSDNPIKTDARRTRRQRTLPPDARCACGEADPRCLTTTGDTVVCYACHGHQGSRGEAEAHHPAGRHNLTATVPIPSNEHRILSDQQQDWPIATLRNPAGSPLLCAAAEIRGWMDVLALILERTIGWVPQFLEALDTWLRTQLGDAWWAEFVAGRPGVVPPHAKGGAQ